MEAHSSMLVLGLLFAALALIVMLLFKRRRAGRRRLTLEQIGDSGRLQGKLASLEAEIRFRSRSMKKLAHFARLLTMRMRAREIPDVVKQIVEQIFEPHDVVVFVRRKASAAHPERETQLIAAASTSTGLKTRSVIRVGRGELGYVASVRRAMDRGELDRMLSIPVDDRERLSGFRADLAAPMTVGDRVLGLVALAGASHRGSSGKHLIDLIAQIGALALSNAMTVSEIRSAADTDALTEVYNKGALNVRLERLVDEAASEGSDFSIFLFDIDHFKNYNDSNGHVAGDELLRALAQLVNADIRSDDIFGRFGGEEFLLILPGRSAEEALVAAEKVRETIEQHDFPFADRQPLARISVSGGVAGFREHGLSSQELLKSADAALYWAKTEGRNRVATPEDLESAPQAEPPAADLTFSHPSTRHDDLKRIRGIGATFERALIEMGIARYRQIAELDWRSMQEVATALNTTPERIVRDRWMQQARELHSKNYGELVRSSFAGSE